MSKFISMNKLDNTIENIISGRRIDPEDWLRLFHHADLLTLGRLASQKRLQLHPEPVVTFVVDRNINYTNICVSGCLFCAFFRSPYSPDAYVISKSVLKQKIEETI